MRASTLLWLALAVLGTACGPGTPDLQVRLIAVGFSSGLEETQFGRLAISEDGGASWTLTSMGEGDEWLTEGYAFDDKHGYILGNKGGLYKTSDGGTTFTRQVIGANSEFLDAIFFQDDQRGYIAGGNLYQITTDGGATWNDGALPDFYFDHFHFFPDGRGVGVEGFLAPQQGILWSTADAGASWTQASITTGGLRAVSFVDSSEGWAVGDLGQTLYTLDGGVTWTPIDRSGTGTAPNLNDVAFADGVGYAVGSSGAVWRLRNLREPESAWELAHAGPYDLRQVWIYDRRIAVAVGYEENTDRGVILRTTDGGRRWDEVYDAPHVFLYGLVGGLIP